MIYIMAIIATLVFMVLFSLINILFTKLSIRMTKRCIRPDEDQLILLDQIEALEDKQEMIDRVRDIYSGFMGDYVCRVPYYRFCWYSVTILFALMLLFFIYSEEFIKEPQYLPFLFILPGIALFSLIKEELDAKKKLSEITYGSWFSGKTDQDIFFFLRETIEKHNAVVEAQKRKNKPAPFLLKYTRLAVGCLAALCVAFWLHVFYGEEPSFLREINYQYTVSDGSAKITGYKGLWTRLHIPSSLGGVPVTAVGEEALYNRDVIRSVRFDRGVRKIESGAFSYCDALTAVMLPEGLEEIGESAFLACNELSDINFPEGLKRIGEKAFSYTGLRTVRLPDGIEAVGAQAFGSRRLERAEFPDTPLSLTANPFDPRSEPLLVISPDHPTLAFRDGALYNIPRSMLLYLQPSRFEAECRIPDGIKAIGGYLFYHHKDLERVYLPDGLTDIGEYAFSDCTGLKEIAFPKGVTSIGEGAFIRCIDLNRVSTSAGPLVIGSKAFCYCNNLREVNLAEGLTRIGGQAFFSCENLKEITLPEGVTDIGDEAFIYCKGLEALSLPDTLLTMGEYMLGYCQSLKSLIIPPRVTSLGLIFGYIFSSEGVPIEALTIPPGVTFIEPRLAYTIPRGACITVGKGSYADTWLKAYEGRFTVQYADFPE